MTPTSEGASAKSQTEINNILTVVNANEHFSTSIFIPSALIGSSGYKKKKTNQTTKMKKESPKLLIIFANNCYVNTIPFKNR